jgi:hypothetical protein
MSNPSSIKALKNLKILPAETDLVTLEMLNAIEAESIGSAPDPSAILGA